LIAVVVPPGIIPDHGGRSALQITKRHSVIRLPIASVAFVFRDEQDKEIRRISRFKFEQTTDCLGHQKAPRQQSEGVMDRFTLSPVKPQGNKKNESSESNHDR
jgi:hypothetical protein